MAARKRQGRPRQHADFRRFTRDTHAKRNQSLTMKSRIHSGSPLADSQFHFLCGSVDNPTQVPFTADLRRNTTSDSTREFRYTTAFVGSPRFRLSHPLHNTLCSLFNGKLEFCLLVHSMCSPPLSCLQCSAKRRGLPNGKK